MLLQLSWPGAPEVYTLKEWTVCYVNNSWVKLQTTKIHSSCNAQGYEAKIREEAVTWMEWEKTGIKLRVGVHKTRQRGQSLEAGGLVTGSTSSPGQLVSLPTGRVGNRNEVSAITIKQQKCIWNLLCVKTKKNIGKCIALLPRCITSTLAHWAATRGTVHPHSQTLKKGPGHSKPLHQHVRYCKIWVPECGPRAREEAGNDNWGK